MPGREREREREREKVETTTKMPPRRMWKSRDGLVDGFTIIFCRNLGRRGDRSAYTRSWFSPRSSAQAVQRQGTKRVGGRGR